MKNSALVSFVIVAASVCGGLFYSVRELTESLAKLPDIIRDMSPNSAQDTSDSFNCLPINPDEPIVPFTPRNPHHSYQPSVSNMGKGQSSEPVTATPSRTERDMREQIGFADCGVR